MMHFRTKFDARGCAVWCIACNTCFMRSTSPNAQLKSVISEGLSRLDAAHGGRYLSTVARRLGVERSTVSRWRKSIVAASPEHCENLARNWPDHFDREELMDLHYRSIQQVAGALQPMAGLEILADAGSLFDAATAEMMIEPESLSDRDIKHCALHMDHHGRDPLLHDPTFSVEIAEKMVAFRSMLVKRAAEGWTVRLVVSAGNIDRLESMTQMVESIDGPNVEIFAYPYSLPLVVSPLVIANRSVLMVHDHRRWERPGAAMLIRSRSAAEWANNYCFELIADAPFRLRNPSGIDHSEFDRFARTLTKTQASEPVAG